MSAVFLSLAFATSLSFLGHAGLGRVDGHLLASNLFGARSLFTHLVMGATTAMFIYSMVALISGVMLSKLEHSVLAATSMMWHMAQTSSRYRRFEFMSMYFNNEQAIKDMTPEQAQLIYRELAQFEFPAAFEFGWIFNFFKTASAPVLSRVICRSGHFTNSDVLTSHKRQQDTVCLMTAMMAQPFHSAFHSLAIARINQHHDNWGQEINSDTILWLSWMWMDGPIQWMNLAGYRKIFDYEKHALFVMWRELSVMLGCKWVPETAEEFSIFRKKFEHKEQRFSEENRIFSDAMMDAVLYSLPGLLKSFGRKCIIALLDEEVRHSNGYDEEFSSILRVFLLHVIKLVGLSHRFLPARNRPRVLSPTTANVDGTVNFPSYTFPATPYYVARTMWNERGPIAIINRVRGLPLPGPEFGSDGVHWEAMGAHRPTLEGQSAAELRVKGAASELQHSQYGYRPMVKYQKKAIVVTAADLPGYGDAKNRYNPEDCLAPTMNDNAPSSITTEANVTGVARLK